MNKVKDKCERMSVALETMGKDYNNDDDIIDKLMKTPEVVVDFDRTWNGTYSFVRCGECNGPMLGHRAEKCRKNGDGYEETVVRRYEMQMRSAVKIRDILNNFMDAKRKQEIDYKQNREIELAKSLPAKTSFMIGTREIPKCIGQDFDVWKKS